MHTRWKRSKRCHLPTKRAAQRSIVSPRRVGDVYGVVPATDLHLKCAGHSLSSEKEIYPLSITKHEEARPSRRSTYPNWVRVCALQRLVSFSCCMITVEFTIGAKRCTSAIRSCIPGTSGSSGRGVPGCRGQVSVAPYLGACPDGRRTVEGPSPSLAREVNGQ